MRRFLVPLAMIGLVTACTPPGFLSSEPLPKAKPVDAVAVAVAKAKAKCGADRKCRIQAYWKAHAKDTYRTPEALALAVGLDMHTAMIKVQMAGPKDKNGFPTDPFVEVKTVVCKPRTATLFDCVVRLSNGEGGTQTYIVPRDGKTYKAQPDPDAGAE